MPVYAVSKLRRREDEEISLPLKIFESRSRNPCLSGSRHLNSSQPAVRVPKSCASNKLVAGDGRSKGQKNEGQDGQHPLCSSRNPVMHEDYRSNNSANSAFRPRAVISSPDNDRIFRLREKSAVDRRCSLDKRVSDQRLHQQSACSIPSSSVMSKSEKDGNVRVSGPKGQLKMQTANSRGKMEAAKPCCLNKPAVRNTFRSFDIK